MQLILNTGYSYNPRTGQDLIEHNDGPTTITATAITAQPTSITGIGIDGLGLEARKTNYRATINPQRRGGSARQRQNRRGHPDDFPSTRR